MNTEEECNVSDPWSLNEYITPYECAICQERFSSNKSLLRHNIVHTREKKYKCVYCDKAYLHCSRLIEHTRLHTGERQYSCTICNKSFTNTITLKRHKRLHKKREYGTPQKRIRIR